MTVVVVASVSSKIADLAMLTTPNKVEYCLRHGYSLLVENRPYDDAIRGFADVMLPLLDRFDLVWALDADAVITDLSRPVHELGCLGPGMTVCEEGIVEWNRVNCGSVIMRAGQKSRTLLRRMSAEIDLWIGLPCQWQTWIGNVAKEPGDLVTVAPLRAFNSCEWTRPGGGGFEAPGSHWTPGDLVYHPCSVFPHDARLAAIKAVLAGGVVR